MDCWAVAATEADWLAPGEWVAATAAGVRVVATAEDSAVVRAAAATKAVKERKCVQKIHQMCRCQFRNTQEDSCCPTSR